MTRSWMSASSASCSSFTNRSTTALIRTDIAAPPAFPFCSSPLLPAPPAPHASGAAINKVKERTTPFAYRYRRRSPAISMGGG
uniref:Uncharacterized protein n=1 Tax=Zea mays TaxID=4577 RepID=C0PG16_MAIZE|nr:unknown [Zea mays]